MKKVLFITPPYHAGVVEVAGRWIPLNMVYLAGAVKSAGFKAEIYDAMTKGVGIEDIKSVIKESDPYIVASSAITATVEDAIEVLVAAKAVKPSVITLLGGIHPTFMYEEILKKHKGSVDFIIVGEGELTIQELLKALASGKEVTGVKGLAFEKDGKIITTQKRELTEDLDSLSKAWELLDWEDYVYFVIPDSRLAAIDTSRGCTKSCTFCSQQKFYDKSWRGRRPENVVQDIENLHTLYGVNVVLFTDDYPTLERDRWEKILDLLIEKNMDVYILMETRVEDILRDKDILHKYRKAGIIHMYIGTEAVNQETLDYMKKEITVEDSVAAIRLLDDFGIITETSMIFGFPFETAESIKNTLELSKMYNPDFCHFLAISPWPYADMYKELEDFIHVDDYRKYNLVDVIVKPEKMSLEEIDQAIVTGYKEFYMGKFGELKNLKDDFKKRYILTAMKLIMSNSFIRKKLGNLGMPPEVKALIKDLDCPNNGYGQIKPSASVDVR